MKLLTILIGLLIVILCRSAIILLGWNLFMPGTFNLPLINLWQALGAGLLVSSLTFKWSEHKEQIRE